MGECRCCGKEFKYLTEEQYDEFVCDYCFVRGEDCHTAIERVKGNVQKQEVAAE